MLNDTRSFVYEYEYEYEYEYVNPSRTSPKTHP
jgi:hypothetical protein